MPKTAHNRFCSRDCLASSQRGRGRPSLVWSPRDLAYLIDRYRIDGPAKVAEVLGKSHRQVRDKANRLHLSSFADGHSRRLRDQPSGLERRIAGMLHDLGVAFEASCWIKPNFVVDFRIGALILEADGDWWHGHPRFEPLKPRQIAQRKRDVARDKYLTACGYVVVRIWESELTEALLIAVLAEHQIAIRASRE